MTDPTPEELDALVAELAFLCSPVAEHMSDGRRITAFCKEARSATNAITALRAREALIETAAIELERRSARYMAQVKDRFSVHCGDAHTEGLSDAMHDAALIIRALAKPGARTLLDQRIADAEQAGYERGLREAQAKKGDTK